MRRTLLSAAAIFVFASPALANQCTALWQQINVKMQETNLPAAEQTKLSELRTQGEQLHHSGKHVEAEAALNQALALFNT